MRTTVLTNRYAESIAILVHQREIIAFGLDDAGIVVVADLAALNVVVLTRLSNIETIRGTTLCQ